MSTFPLSCHECTLTQNGVKACQITLFNVLKCNDTFINGVYFICLFYCNLLTHNPHTECPEHRAISLRPLTAATVCVIYVNYIIFSFLLLIVSLLQADELFLEAYTEIII